jgi:REP element-mobilizing transposase RayT
MARSVRVEFPGAIYHVTARGNERRTIYRDERDYHLWLEALAETQRRLGWKIHGYCVMKNHYHLLVETPEANLSQGMSWLQTTFTIRYNRKYRRSGHLFQGRYKAQVLDSESYGYKALLYIHLNPVRLVKWKQASASEKLAVLDVFLWSSHRFYLGKAPPPAWLSLEWLRYWGLRTAAAHRGYRLMVRETVDQELERPWHRPKGGCYVGEDKLWEKVERLLESKDRSIERKTVESAQRERQRVSILKGLQEESDGRVRWWVRTILCGQPKTLVAKEEGVHGSTITQSNKRLETRALTDKMIAAKLDQWRKRWEG